MADREQFLIGMYSKMWDNIDRHILVVWQSVAVLASAFAALMLPDKNTLPADYATTLVVLVGAWQIAHVLDANWWFNRNLLIVANIERQFFTVNDAKEIHYYFLQHRKPTVLDHYKIQLALGGAVIITVLLFHFSHRLYALLFRCEGSFENAMVLPYVTFFLAVVLIFLFQRHQGRVYNRLKEASPGKNLTAE